MISWSNRTYSGMRAGSEAVLTILGAQTTQSCFRRNAYAYLFPICGELSSGNLRSTEVKLHNTPDIGAWYHRTYPPDLHIVIRLESSGGLKLYHLEGTTARLKFHIRARTKDGTKNNNIRLRKDHNECNRSEETQVTVNVASLK
jgi:hypothetical protein